ncbi:MAG: hypothetical protein ABSF66_06520 [Terriglobales bacterium]
MTHQAPATQPVHLSSSQQRELSTRIAEAQRKVNQLEGKIREEQEKLASARDIYNRACELVAQNKSDDAQAARDVVLRHEDKILGMKSLLHEPAQLLDQLLRELSAEVARDTEARQAVEILDEQDTIGKQAERALHAITERDRCTESITSIVANLRSRTYKTAANKHAAFEAAYKIERKAAGMN